MVVYKLLVFSVSLALGLSCPPGKKTSDDQGRCCAFPFTSSGETYNACIGDEPYSWCSLTPTYTGSWAYCVTPCTSSPCKNGGTCKISGDYVSHSCQCTQGFYGDNCEKESPCNSSPCKNGATCTMTGHDSYSCNCTDEFEGPTCEERLPCPPGKKTSDSEGRCCAFPFTSSGQTYNACIGDEPYSWCSLTPTYHGSWAYCVTPCTSIPCKNGGTCKISGDYDSHSCQCTQGFYGDNCEKESPCNSSPCKNGATCTMTGHDSYSCKCTDEFEGPTCEKRLPCPPGKETSDAEGRCCSFPFTSSGETYNACIGAEPYSWCSLTPTYTGSWAYCVTPCTSSPCKNGGTCKISGDYVSHSCQCTEGFYGDNCEKESPCNSSPCKNGATCTMTGHDSYSCNCTDEFEGPTCEERLPCPPGKKTDDAEGRCCAFPFIYSGQTHNACIGDEPYSWCSLTPTYSGSWAYCVNECGSLPCKNGASCKETMDGYSCQPCPNGWRGKDCDEDIDECKSTPCKNGGTCLNNEGTFTCTCQAGLTGKLCEQDIDECKSAPCKNGGTCVNKEGTFTCSCEDGFTGERCDQDIDECKATPCKNGGTCVNKEGTFACNCKAGFQGKLCEQVYWKPEGCFKEKSKRKRLLKKTFIKRVKGITDIGRIFEKCKAKAEKKGYEIFAIKNTNSCVTSKNGKVVNFKKYGETSNCKTDDEGHGIGMVNSAIFVYTR